VHVLVLTSEWSYYVHGRNTIVLTKDILFFSDSFILAAQVALGAALTLAFLALAVLFWKSCHWWVHTDLLINVYFEKVCFDNWRWLTCDRLSDCMQHTSSTNSISCFGLRLHILVQRKFSIHSPLRLVQFLVHTQTSTYMANPKIMGIYRMWEM